MLKKIWPILLITFFLVVVVITNSSSFFLTGWDNLQTELNPLLNIKRAVFSVWQEYQGLGVVAGNAHAVDLVRQLFASFLSITFPINLIRQIYVFLMLFVGAIGAYLMLKKLLFEKDSGKNQVLSMLGSLFYVFNLSTIQTFYAPFEPFVTHFGFLPWLILALCLYLISSTKKRFLFFSFITLISIPQFQVPTIFFVYCIILFIFLLVFNLKSRSKATFMASIRVVTVTLMLHSFWLLPFLYFLLTNSGVALGAKINQMATQTVYAQNKAFGDLTDVILLKGFWFNNVDPDSTGKFTYMLLSWREYLQNIYIVFLGYLFFAISIFGLLTSLKNKKPITTSFCILFITCFTMLAVNFPPFSYINSLFRQLPLINEAFRFPFTKFSILASLMYSVFFAIGIGIIVDFVQKIIRSSKINLSLVTITTIALLIISVFPVFKGELFYSKEKINIPNEYFHTFNYFKTQDPNTRIANLPQPTFWGWSNYKWGYGGSGFIWYGIKQPILDRAFDVWSENNENYYWEMSYALYSKNSTLFENVLNKYQISWLLVDKNIVYPSSPLSLFVPELKGLIKEIPSIKQTARFGEIEIYKVDLRDKPQNFVFSDKNLESVNDYKWQNNDKAYQDLGNYYTNSNSKYIYPFRSLLSTKNQANNQFTLKNDKDNLVLENSINSYSSDLILNIPSFAEKEQIIAVSLKTKEDKDNFIVTANIYEPEIFLVNKNVKTKVFNNNQSINLISIPKVHKNDIVININGVKTFSLNDVIKQNSPTTFFTLKQDNVIVFKGILSQQSVTVEPATILNLLGVGKKRVILSNIDKNSLLLINIPKINDSYEGFEINPEAKSLKEVHNCNYFNKGEFSSSLQNIDKTTFLKLSSKNSTACLSHYLPSLIHNQGYGIFVNNINEKGRPLHFWMLNENEKYAPIDTYLNSRVSSYIMPPQDEFGRAYSLQFENISLTNNTATNYLGKISIYPIPYNFINSLYFSSNNTKEELITNNFSENAILHPNEYTYIVKGVNKDNLSTIILSQGFDKGWQAYKITKSNSKLMFLLRTNLPFIFGSRLENHLKINNWENGWKLEKDKKNYDLVIVFLPQYLEFIGFILVFLCLLPILRPKSLFLRLESIIKRALKVDKTL